MDFTKGEIERKRLWLIASATNQGPLIAGTSAAMSRRQNTGGGDEPELQIQDFTFGEIHQRSFLLRRSPATSLFKML